MKIIIFDTGPIISLAMNNLLWLLKPLKERFQGEFYITEGVKKECVDRPLTSKKFRFEAIQVLKLIEDGILKVYDNEKVKTDALYFMERANTLFRVHENPVRIIQFAEMEVVTAGRLLDADAVVIDEFITRSLLDNPSTVGERLKKRLHLEVEEDREAIKKFRQDVSDIKIIRSFELVTVAYELGLFKDYYLKMPNAKKTLLEGLLWGVKLNGCSVSEQEIEQVIKAERV